MTAPTFLHNPSTATFQNGSPDLTVGAISAGSNRKLVVVLAARSSNVPTWAITTFTIGGQTYDQALETAVIDGKLCFKIFVWNEATIAAMTGTAVSFADTPTTLNGQYCTYFVVQDCSQASLVLRENGAANSAASITVSTVGNTLNDLIVAGVAFSDDPPVVSTWDTLTEIPAATDDDGSSISVGLASGNTTDESHLFTTTGSGQDIVAFALKFSGITSTTTIQSVGNLAPAIIYDNELRVRISGVGFGSPGTVYLHDDDPVNGTPTVSVEQTAVRSWSDEEIVFDVDKGAHTTSDLWLAVTNDSASEASIAVTCNDDPGAGTVAVRRDPVPDRTITQGVSVNIDMADYFFASDVQDSLTFSASGLPPGLSISTDGVISGTIASGEAANSPFTVDVTCTDSDGNSVTDQFTWTVSTGVGGLGTSSGLRANLRRIFGCRLFGRR